MLLILLAVMTLMAWTATSSSPHIVVIVADDLGWGDVSWRDSEMATPNLEKMADEGVKLTQSYALASIYSNKECLLD